MMYFTEPWDEEREPEHREPNRCAYCKAEIAPDDTYCDAVCKLESEEEQ
jgi:hypothetical protein